MAEYTDEQEQHPPRWVPYTPPTPDGWDRVRLWARRLLFPLMVVAFVGGVAGVVYWSMQKNTLDDVSEHIPAVIPSPSEEQNKGVAWLTVRSAPEGAAVRVNGDSIGTTPLVGRPLDTGVYMLSIRSEGYFRADTVLVMSDGAASTLRMSLRPRPGTSPQEAAAAASPSASPKTKVPSALAPAPRPTPPPRSTPKKQSAPPATSPPPKPAPTVGRLTVTSEPAGAAVRVNGTSVGRTPLELSAIPFGAAQVAVELDRYESWSTEVTVRDTTTQHVHAPLQPQTGRLRVLAQPWGTIYINGTLQTRDSDIWYETLLPIGTYRVTVVHPTLGQRVTEVQVHSGEDTSVVVDLQAKMSSDATP